LNQPLTGRNPLVNGRNPLVEAWLTDSERPSSQTPPRTCDHRVNWYGVTLDACYQSVMVDESSPIRPLPEDFTG
jgi:hypothetical protein